VCAINNLKVISRTSAMKYKRSDKCGPEIADELGVGSTLEGSVRKARTRARLGEQLIDACTDEHVWSQSYDRELEDILDYQWDWDAAERRSKRTIDLNPNRSLVCYSYAVQLAPRGVSSERQPRLGTQRNSTHSSV
jgi:TolB-like protein